MRAVALLSLWKLKNSLRTVFSDPRKLIPFAIFLVIVGLMVTLANVGINQPHPNLSQEHLDPKAFTVGVSIALILLGLSFIDSGLGDGLLSFGMPDLDYLFPSPISRRVVLAYRLPSLLFSALFMAGFVLMALNLTTQVAHPMFANVGKTLAPGWAPPAALFLSGGIYMNLAMLISIKVPNRKYIHRALMAVTIGLCAGLGVLGWLKGLGAVESVVLSPIVWWLFLPSSLASESLLAGFSHHATVGPLAWLLFGYIASMIPMFLSNSNWYEQSIVSTERVTAVRNAARGGYSSLMAAKASTYRSTRAKMYTVKPFGQGAWALFWAHLCAAAKKPTANFIGPFFGGVLAGLFAAYATAANVETENIGYSALTMLALYCSMGFMATAKTACEAAIRRRELLSPLPISGWQSVAANLGAPFCTALLFFFGCAMAYVAVQGPHWPMVAFGFGLALPLRLAARMILQYIVVIAYPDAADKMQQFLAVGVYLLLATPFVVFEGILCIPGLIFHSMWLILILLTLFQIPLGFFLLVLAGKASEKAIATGEPVRLLSLIKKSR